MSEIAGEIDERPAGHGRQARTVALVVAVAFFMQLLDGTIIATSLPQMGESFGVRPVDMSIGITAYMLTMAAFIPLSGWLGDRFGARRIFLLSIVIFTIASLFCGLSQNLWQFVVARALQGTGGALMIPVGSLIVLKNAKKSELVGAIALITWPALTAPVLGPLLGGFITTYASWHWNFFINLPIGALGIALVLRFIPETRDTTSRRLDILGFLLSAGGLTAVLASLETLVHGTLGILEFASLALGALLLAAAAWHFGRVKEPLLDLSTFRVQTFAASSATGGLACRTAISATPFLLPLLFQVGFGVSAIVAGGYVLVYFLGNLTMKTVTTPLLRLIGFRPILVGNGVLNAASIAACGLLTPTTPEALIYGLLFLSGMFRSMQFTAMNSLGFADIGPTQRSSATTLSSMLQQISMLLGVAIAAAALNLSAQFRGLGHVELADFRIAFGLAGLIALVAALSYMQLPKNVASEVSGHKA